MSDEKLSKESSKRLEAMCQTTDGFELAELDLKLRGAGDINGTMQSGDAFDLKIANPTYDNQILQVAQELAISILEIDATLSHPEHIALRELRDRFAPENKGDFSDIS
jgi:ATP-dependent DNA helicase RecG